MRQLVRYGLVAVALCLTVTSASAQRQREQRQRDLPEGSQLLNAVTACRTMTDDAARLACYDASVAQLSSAAAQRDVVVLDRSEVRRTRRSLFGFSLPRIPFFGGDDEDEREQIREIDSTITRVASDGTGRFNLTLQDESVWQTTESIRSSDPRAGQAIRIRAAALGSYMANINQARAVRVRRIR